MSGKERTPNGRRVVLFPLPFQGHISPMLQIAAVLHARGFAITVLHTRFNAPDPSRHRGYRFVPINETLTEEAASGKDILTQLLALNVDCEAPFRETLASLLPDPAGGRGRGGLYAVIDGQWYTMIRAATQLGVAALALRTESAAAFYNMLAYPRLRAAGYIPIQEAQMDALVPELPLLRVRDLLRVDGTDTDMLCDFIAWVGEATRTSASGVVVNTFDAIEAPELDMIQRDLSLPAFAIGPLHKLSPPIGNSLLAPDATCLEWLDTQAPLSVLYVSQGSIACIDPEDFEEIAWGLANTGVPFLWVVRPGLVRGMEEEVTFPNGFLDACKSGKIVRWAPQRDVLAHEAVGGFWTHSGWNSTLESLCEGVPMLCQPCFADQNVNARYAACRWGVGLEAGRVVERGAIEEAVRRLMVGDEGAQVRERARTLKEQAAQCVAKGGSSYVAVDRLVDYLSLRF